MLLRLYGILLPVVGRVLYMLLRLRNADSANAEFERLTGQILKAVSPEAYTMQERAKRKAQAMKEHDLATGFIRLAPSQIEVGEEMLESPEEIFSADTLSQRLKISQDTAITALQRLYGHGLLEIVPVPDSHQICFRITDVQRFRDVIQENVAQLTQETVRLLRALGHGSADIEKYLHSQ